MFYRANRYFLQLQESAELLTEEGALLADIQGDAVVDYDIDRYVSRLDEVRLILSPKQVNLIVTLRNRQILAQKAETIEGLRQQLSAFRKRCEEEEHASRAVG